MRVSHRSHVSSDARAVRHFGDATGSFLEVDNEYNNLSDFGLDTDTATLDVDSVSKRALKNALHKWRVAAKDDGVKADLIRDYYELLDVLGVREWDLDDPMQVNRLGTLARFSELLADYESVRRRSRVDAENAGEQVGGQDRGIWYYKNLGFHVLNYAQGAYEGFDGESDAALDAVNSRRSIGPRVLSGRWCSSPR